MVKKSEPASIQEVAFNCLFCGAYTEHTWFSLHCAQRPSESRTPPFIDQGDVARFKEDVTIPENLREQFSEYWDRMARGRVFLEQNKSGRYLYADVQNLSISKCYVCKEFAVWVHGTPVFPPASEGPPANDDLPEDVRGDYDEASQILRLSPRGSAALLRLSIQKLCISLGEKGKSIDDDIKSLVEKGLSPLVQKALDSVRVIGNEAVHPGVLDIKDNPAIAAQLFKLVNIVAEQMISNPKHVKEVYAQLPEGKLAAIEQRDAPKT